LFLLRPQDRCRIGRYIGAEPYSAALHSYSASCIWGMLF
jgi:hypothetical protein